MVEAVDLLDLKKILIGHDEATAGGGWYLERVLVRVTNPETNKRQEFRFICNRYQDLVLVIYNCFLCLSDINCLIEHIPFFINKLSIAFELITCYL